MVDVVASNAKLRKRALRLVRALTDVSDERANDLLAASGGSVKVAAVMAWRKTSAADARAILDAAGGMLRRVRS
jgi:N-acetylmuramic acid 6-phosphate etherase